MGRPRLMWSSPIIHKFQFTSHRNPFLGLRNRAATVPPSRERPVWVETCRSIRRSPWEGRQHPSPNHGASRPVNRPRRNPAPVVAICTIRSPISIGASRLSAPSPLPPKSHSERRTANRTPTSPYDFSPGKEHGVCIWKSDLQILTVLAVNRT